MNGRPAFWLGVLFLGAAWGGTTLAVQPSRTISASRQFVAYTDDPLRGATWCARAEQIKRGWLALLELPDQWRDPVIIVSSPDPAARLAIFRTDEHLKYQIYCAATTPPDELTLAVVEALCRELANRTLPLNDPPLVGAQVPVWLVAGLAAALPGQNDAQLPRLEQSASDGQLPVLQQILTTDRRPVHRDDRQRFERHSLLLVESLMALPGGAANLRRLLTEAAPTVDPADLFAAVYRAQWADEFAREKWWSLEVARKMTMVLAGNLSAAETARRLDDILRTTLQRTNQTQVVSVALADLWRHDREPWFWELVQNKQTQLQILSNTAHPLYRPVIAAYLDALTPLRQAQVNRYREAVKRADARRAEADRRLRQIQQFVTQSEQRSPISRYLDQFDQ